jgi:hypothetical protein
MDGNTIKVQSQESKDQILRKEEMSITGEQNQITECKTWKVAIPAGKTLVLFEKFNDVIIFCV